MRKICLFSLVTTAVVGAMFASTYESLDKLAMQSSDSESSVNQCVSIDNPQISTSSAKSVRRLSGEELKSVVTDSDVDLTIENDSKYPWTLEDDHLVNGNRGVKGSTSTLSISFNTDKTTEVSFDWLRNYYLNGWHTVFLYVDGVNMGSAASNSYESKSFCVEKGSHIIMFKDTISSAYNSYYDHDYSYIKNISVKKIDQLQVNITTPGSLGDSILAHVEYFSDVKSIKISGSLNSEDLTTIKTRLTNAREMDISEIDLTEIPSQFFYNNKQLEFIKLPSKLTVINDHAFRGCSGIRNISFPSTLQEIKNYAFEECDYLQEVILPEGLTTLGEAAFSHCDNNKYVKLPTTLKEVSNTAFYCNVSLKNVDFAEGLTHIGSSAFNECHSLQKIIFPNTLYYIGSSAFSRNTSLTSVTFNEGLYQIGNDAFWDCDGLKEVTLPSSLVLCYDSPFDRCDSLKKVTCLSMEPPYLTEQIPNGCDMTGRELYVPFLSINSYKQSTGWDKFPTIKPIDALPENFTVLSDLKLTLPETIPAGYKPNVDVIHDMKGSSYYQYGSLTVNGSGTLSMNRYQMFWDPYYQHYRSDRTQNFTSLVNNSTLRADSVFIKMEVCNDRWSFITLPFNAKVSDIETYCDGTTNWVIRKYDGQKRANGETDATWVKMTADSTLQAGQGYIIQASRYVGTNSQYYSGFIFKAVNDAKKNNIFISKDASVSLGEYQSEFAHNRSWNLIGNPYPCYYDTRFMDFDAPITVWDLNYSTYTAYSPADDSYVLCPGESFFVQCPVDNGTIAFSKEGRQTNRTARTLEAASAKRNAAASVSPRTIINLTLSDGTTTDKTRIVINDAAKLQYEIDKDASKFMSTDASVPQIYTSADGVDYAINERPTANGIVNIGTRINVEGFYTITLANSVEGYDVVLEDKLLGKQIIMAEGSEYTFSAKDGDSQNRFVLRLTSKVTGIKDVNVNDNDNDNNAIYNLAGQRVNANAKGGIYILNGKKIMLNK